MTASLRRPSNLGSAFFRASLSITVKGACEGARVGIMSEGRGVNCGSDKQVGTSPRIPLLSVSGFNSLQSHPLISGLVRMTFNPQNGMIHSCQYRRCL